MTARTQMQRKMQCEADGLLSTLQCSAACAAPAPAPAPAAPSAAAPTAAMRPRPASATYAPDKPTIARFSALSCGRVAVACTKASERPLSAIAHTCMQ